MENWVVFLLSGVVYLHQLQDVIMLVLNTCVLECADATESLLMILIRDFSNEIGN